MKQYFTSYFLLISILAFSQKNDFATMEKFAQTITPADLKAHLTFLADDELEGRETGTRGQRVAGLYIASQFMKMGLQAGNIPKKSYFQPYKVSNIQIEDANVLIGKSKFLYTKDYFCYAVAAVPKEISGAWEFAGYAYQDEKMDYLKALTIKDKNIFSFAGGPAFEGKDMREIIRACYKKRSELQAKGAKSFWVVLPDELFSRMNQYVETSGMSLLGDDVPFPMFFVSTNMGDAFLKQSKSSVKKASDLYKVSDAKQIDAANWQVVYQVKKEEKLQLASNVLGYLEGTDKKQEIIVITAHYDHLGVKKDGTVYNGADDDGSGTVSVLEMAEAFQKAAEAGHRPRRSILFMTVSGEEKGLWGSEFYTDNPVFLLENTVANLNIDMIGRTDNFYEGKKDSVNYVYMIGSDRLSTELDSIIKDQNTKFTDLTLDYRYNDPKDPNDFYSRSDHYNFARYGVPVNFFFTGTHEDYHQPEDDIEKIHFEKTAKIAKLIFASAWELANRENRIVVDKK